MLNAIWEGSREGGQLKCMRKRIKGKRKRDVWKEPHGVEEIRKGPRSTECKRSPTKGKGDRKGNQGTCYKCGKVDHSTAECRSVQAVEDEGGEHVIDGA